MDRSNIVQFCANAAQMAGHKLSDWYVRHKDVLMRRVNGVPGIIREVSFSPDPQVAAHSDRISAPWSTVPVLRRADW